jgi:HAE1 family hydrophobic/amphiphilic exporter-1
MARNFEDAREKLADATKGISALCVRRPVLTLVLNLLIIVAGIAAYQGIEIREMPGYRPAGDHHSRDL